MVAKTRLNSLAALALLVRHVPDRHLFLRLRASDRDPSNDGRRLLTGTAFDLAGARRAFIKPALV
jgi:hypothetical protein